MVREQGSELVPSRVQIHDGTAGTGTAGTGTSSGVVSPARDLDGLCLRDHLDPLAQPHGYARTTVMVVRYWPR
jgi:hypothetical protein